MGELEWRQAPQGREEIGTGMPGAGKQASRGRGRETFVDGGREGWDAKTGLRGGAAGNI